MENQILTSKLLFVGEKRSQRAIDLGLTWKDGGLAAKQLFDAFKACGIDPTSVEFTNWFERGGIKKTTQWCGVVIAMGRKVSDALKQRGIEHIAIVHPAARGHIRRKDRYAEHIKTQLEGVI